MDRYGICSDILSEFHGIYSDILPEHFSCLSMCSDPDVPCGARQVAFSRAGGGEVKEEEGEGEEAGKEFHRHKSQETLTWWGINGQILPAAFQAGNGWDWGLLEFSFIITIVIIPSFPTKHQ